MLRHLTTVTGKVRKTRKFGRRSQKSSSVLISPKFIPRKAVKRMIILIFWDPTISEDLFVLVWPEITLQNNLKNSWNQEIYFLMCQNFQIASKIILWSINKNLRANTKIIIIRDHLLLKIYVRQLENRSQMLMRPLISAWGDLHQLSGKKVVLCLKIRIIWIQQKRRSLNLVILKNLRLKIRKIKRSISTTIKPMTTNLRMQIVNKNLAVTVELVPTSLRSCLKINRIKNL